MKEEKLQNNNHEGIKIMCLVFGIVGIVLLLIAMLIVPLFAFISLILFILGIIFSAVYKSKAGLVINIVGICLFPLILIISYIMIKTSLFRLYNTTTSMEQSLESNYQNTQTTNSKSTIGNESKIIKEFYKYFNSSKEKIIYYASSTCSYCKMQTPILEQIATDNKLDYLKIDTTELTKEEIEKITQELDIEPSTPTTVVVKNGKVISTQVGYVDKEGMIEFLKKANVISNQNNDTNSLTNINYTDYKEIINKKGKNIIVIGQTGCGHCTSVKPKLNEIINEYNIVINYLNLTDMNYNDRSNLVDGLGEIGYDEENYIEYGSFGTPLTLIIEDGKVISYVLGDQDKTTFVNTFKSTNIIKN